MTEKIKSKILVAVGTLSLWIALCAGASSQSMQVHFIDV